MSFMTTAGRRGIVAVFAATIITTTACGTNTGTQVQDSVPQAPGAIQAPGHSATSADSAERQGAEAPTVSPTPRPTSPPAPAGMRVPD